MERLNIFVIFCSLSFLLQSGVLCYSEISTPKHCDTPAELTPAGRIAQIEMLLQDPKATFFTGENMTGEALNYDSNETTYPGSCHSVGHNVIKSMRISNSCVRVFEYDFCGGLSRSLYPKPNSGSFVNFLTPELDVIESIGPCLPNEFQYANAFLNGSRIALTKDESNVRHVPDFVDFRGVRQFATNSTKIDSPTNSIAEYYMNQGRPEWIYARIFSNHLRNEAGGEAGRNLAIPPGLGGPKNVAYNMFYQSKDNYEEWKQVMGQIQSHLRANIDDWVAVYLTLAYENSSVTRPYGLYYSVSFVDSRLRRRLYGFIEN